jgi:hypothetical protein
MKYIVASVLSLMVMTCAGSTTSISSSGSVTTSPYGGVSWTGGINITISIARALLPGVAAYVDGRPDVPASIKPSVDEATHIALDSLGIVSTDLNALNQSSSPDQLCRVHTGLELAFTNALAVITIVRDANIPVDPLWSSGIGGLAAAIDMLTPGCPGSVHAQRESAQIRFRHMLEASRR